MGYNVVENGSANSKEPPKRASLETETYPHAVFFDFVAYLDRSIAAHLTEDLTILNEHVPVSASIGDMLEREPTHICEPDPKTLIRKMMEELDR